MKLTKILITAFVGVCIVAIGLTAALMHDVTDPVVNTFSASKGITLELKEPTWDGYELGTTYPAEQEPGAVANPNATAENLGITKARNYHPGDVIAKNPTVKNTSEENAAIYTAIKVEFMVDGTSITKDAFEANYGKLQFNGTEGMNENFVEISNTSTYALYFYDDVLANEETITLFDNVVINKDIKVNGSKWPEFQIKVTAYGVQSVNINSEEAKEALVNLATNVEGGN